MTSKNVTPEVSDAVVIGAGFGGMYQLYRLREQGLRVVCCESGGGVGGAWYWNRYPGARTDSPSHTYQYWFSDDLLNEWNWQERFPPQAETESYLNHVADRFDLRKDIRFNTRVAGAVWNQARNRWLVTTDQGDEIDTQFVISCTGVVSAPLLPPFEGAESFKGETFHTARWPRDGVNLENKRVGIIGTGATAIQVIQTIAPVVKSLTVFQRTANYMIPIRNPKLSDADRAAIKAKYPELKTKIPTTFVGFDVDVDPRSASEVSPEDRRALLEALWADGSLAIWLAGFRELFTDPVVNAEYSEFVREKMRARIKNPELARKLIPTDHGFGTRRVPLENGYLEVYERDNVYLADLKEEAIERVTPSGIKTSKGEYDFDVLIMATGFDASTGTLTRMDVRGRDGRSLKEHWQEDLRTMMGLQVHGFPNLFMTSAPFAPGAAFCNVPTCLQQQVDWITDCIRYVRARAQEGRIEPRAEAEAQWMAHHDELSNATLIGGTPSWYTGENVPGKRKRVLGYFGVGKYREICEDIKVKDYEGFEIA